MSTTDEADNTALLIHELDRLLDIGGPDPSLIHRVRFSLGINETGGEPTTGVTARRVGQKRHADDRTITFCVADFTIMITVLRINERHHIDGWVVPTGAHHVEIRVDGEKSVTTTTSGDGRFTAVDLTPGVTQIVVKPAEADRGTIVTPSISL